MIIDELSPGRRHRILATDMDAGVLARARNGGPYTSSDVSSVDRRLLSKYFTTSDGEFSLVERLRAAVKFKQHDLLADEYEREFDLIICRNVSIYFSDQAKRKLNLRFLGSLKENGVLFIGATETLLDAAELGLERLFTGFYQKSASTGTRRDREGVITPLRV